MDERLQQHAGQVDDDQPDQAASRHSPERRLREVLAPESAPARDGAPVDVEQLGQLPHGPGRGTLPHGGHQDHHGTQKNLPTEKPHRGRGGPFAATVPLTAEAQAVSVGFRQVRTSAAWIARVIGAVQSTAARTTCLARSLRQLLVDLKKKVPEAGIAKQNMIHRGVLRDSFARTYGVHPSETSIKRSGSSRGRFLKTSASSRRNRRNPLPDFAPAQQASDLRAEVALAFIKSMYAIEKRIRQRKAREWAELSIDERAERVRQVRQAETLPLLNNLGVWLRQTSGHVLPKSDLSDAIRYTLNQWDALQVFTTCGLLDPDNNEAERGHRGIAIGRNNWRMVGSDRGGEAAAIHFSFIASCKMNNVEPFAYLVDVLRRLPTTPRDQLVDLLPHRWKLSTAPPVTPADPTATI